MRTTIVGGRPPGSGRGLGEIPRGIEVLVKKASVDAQFRRLLLEKRADAAGEIGLVLDPAEAAMISAVPAGQLETIIQRTTVPQEHRRAFLGRAAAAMLAALAATNAGLASAAIQVQGIMPDLPPEPFGGTPRGIRPDLPPEGGKLVSRADQTRITVIAVIAKTLDLRHDQVSTRSALVRDLHADAKQRATIRGELERLFRITIPADTFEGFVTVGDLVEYVDFQDRFERPVIDLMAKELRRRGETITVATRLVEDLEITRAQRVRLKRKLAGEFHIQISWEEFTRFRNVGEVIGCVGKAVELREKARAARKEPEPPPAPPVPPRVPISYGIRPSKPQYSPPPQWKGAVGGIRPGSGGGAP